MKAKVVVMGVYEGMNGPAFTQLRLWIPDADNLLLWAYDNRVHVDETFDPATEVELKIIGEIEVADEIVKSALELERAQRALHEKVENLLPKWWEPEEIFAEDEDG